MIAVDDFPGCSFWQAIFHYARNNPCMMGEVYMPQFFTVKEAIKALHISRPTISRRIKTGEIPATKIGSRILIPAVFIQQLQDRAMKSQTPEAE
jgi:excisionase family DNA binding protein